MLTPRPSLLRQTNISIGNCRRSFAPRFFHTSRPHSGRTLWWHGATLPIAVAMATSCCVLLSAPLARLDSPSSASFDKDQLVKLLKDYPLADLFNSVAAQYFGAPPEKKRNLCAVIAYVWLATIRRRKEEGWQLTAKDVQIISSAIRVLQLDGKGYIPDDWKPRFEEQEEGKLKAMATMTGSSWTGAPPASEDLKTTLTGFHLANFLQNLPQGTSDALHDPNEIFDPELAEGPTQSDFMTLLNPSERILICQALKKAFIVMQKAKMDSGKKAALEAEYLRVLGVEIDAKSEELVEHAMKLAAHFEDLTRKQIIKASKKVVVVNDRNVWPNPLS